MPEEKKEEKKEEKLTPAEIAWARGWVRGVARLLAIGPPGEKPEITEEQIKKIEQIALEPGSAVYEKARKWRKRMIEVFSPIPPS